MHKIAAVGASSLLFSLALAPAAVAGATAHFGVGGAKKGIANTNITGKPAKFSPSKLTVKKHVSGDGCSSSSPAWFSVTNKENKTETVTATSGLSGSGQVAAHQKLYVCVPSTYRGSATFELNDHKKLNVKFQ